MNLCRLSASQLTLMLNSKRPSSSESLKVHNKLSSSQIYVLFSSHQGGGGFWLLCLGLQI